MIAKVGVVTLALGVIAFVSAEGNLTDKGAARISKEVRHEIVTLLPYYGVFDNLAYRVAPDGTVYIAAITGSL